MNKKIVLILPLFMFCGCVATTSQSSIDELKKEVRQKGSSWHGAQRGDHADKSFSGDYPYGLASVI